VSDEAQKDKRRRDKQREDAVAGGFNYGDLTFDPAVMEAMQGLKGGKARMQTVLSQLFNKGAYKGKKTNIDSTLLNRLLGNGATADHFLNRILNYNPNAGGGAGGGGGGGVGAGQDGSACLLYTSPSPRD